MSLIRDGSEVNGIKKHQAKMTLETTPFSTTFGPKAQRKRVKLSVNSINDLAEDTDKSLDTYKERQDQIRLLSGASGTPGDDEDDASVPIAKEAVFTKGQSKRIWNELYRTIDSSDVIIHVLDARDPLGTRCRAVEEYLRKEKPHVKLIMVLNKVDLLPTSVVVSTNLTVHALFSPSTQRTLPQCLSQVHLLHVLHIAQCGLFRYTLGILNSALARLWSLDWRSTVSRLGDLS